MSLLWHVSEFLVPSFLRHTTSQRPSSRIAVLDSLRAIASLIVFNAHFTGNLTANSDWGFGADDIYVPSQLPFVRLLFCGSASVTVFFIVSGYVLSYQPLEDAYLRFNPDAAARRIASLIIRRPIRLCLPALVTILICAFSSYLGLFDAARSNYGTDNEPYWLHQEPPPHFESLSAQILDAIRVFYSMMKLGVGSNNKPPSEGSLYDAHLWTIPNELHAFMLLCLVLICVSRMSPRYGQATFIILIIHAFCCDRWEIICFAAGALMAISDIVHPKQQFSHTKGLSMLTIGLLFLSCPVQQCQQDPFFNWLTPTFLHSQSFGCGCYIRIAGGVLTVSSVLHLPVMQRILVNRVLSYLGNVSYSIYLVHGPIIRCLFHSAIPSIYERTGDGTYDGQDAEATVMAWFLGQMLCFPVIIWAADLLWRAVDQPSQRAAKRLEKLLYTNNIEKDK